MAGTALVVCDQLGSFFVTRTTASTHIGCSRCGRRLVLPIKHRSTIERMLDRFKERHTCAGHEG